MTIIETLRNLAAKNIKKIVLPEGEEERVIKAAAVLFNEKLVSPVLLGKPAVINEKARALNIRLGDIRIIDPAISENATAWADEYYTMRKHKGLTPEKARETIKNPLFFGAFMIKHGLTDGAVAGSVNTTGDVLRAAIQIVGLAENVSVVSSSFIMALKDGTNYTFADCAVIPDPDPDQLASIAISSAHTHKKLLESEPRIAMLSFSTKGSAAHPNVEKVQKATEIVKSRAAGLTVDGELQFDAALLESVGSRKAPGSPVAGKANIFVFPNLDSGNIGYKITQRLAGAEAIGPVIQGLKKPYNDLSRGCSVDDIINVACICSILS